MVVVGRIVVPVRGVADGLLVVEVVQEPLHVSDVNGFGLVTRTNLVGNLMIRTPKRLHYRASHHV